MKHFTLFKAMFIILFLGTYQIYAQSNAVSVGVQITKTIDNDKNYQDAAIVSNDVLLNGIVIINAGTPVNIDVQYERSRGCGKEGYISINTISTTTNKGELIRLTGSLSKEGRNRQGTAIGCGIAFGITLFPIGLFFFCIKGGNASIPAGSLIMATGYIN